MLEAEGGPYGPNKVERLVIVSTDRATLPDATTWSLVTNLPAPGRAAPRSHAPATVLDVAHLYGLRVWIEQSYRLSENVSCAVMPPWRQAFHSIAP